MVWSKLDLRKEYRYIKENHVSFILIVPIHLLLISYTGILFLTNRNIDPPSLYLPPHSFTMFAFNILLRLLPLLALFATSYAATAAEWRSRSIYQYVTFPISFEYG